MIQQPTTDAEVFAELRRRGIVRVDVAFTTTDGERAVQNFAFMHASGPASMEPRPDLHAATADSVDTTGAPIAEGTAIVATTHDAPGVRRASHEEIKRGRLYAALAAPVETAAAPGTLEAQTGTVVWDVRERTRTIDPSA